jgi:uncharacterized membrane protein
MTGQNIAETIQHFKVSNSLFIGLCLYSASTTLTIIIMMVNRKKTKHRYMTWATEQIHLGVWSRTYEIKPDEFIEQLWDENENRGKQIAILKEEHSALKRLNFFLRVLAIIAFIIGIVITLWRFKINSTESKEEKTM